MEGGGVFSSKYETFNSSVNTDMPASDIAFYGLKDMNIGSWMKFGIFFRALDES